MDTQDPGAVIEPIQDRVSQPNGTIISGRYRIEGVLGSGGMGTVYLVQHTHMRKRFALKMLHAETSQVPELVARFEREAVAMSRADHPNIATATDFGRADNGAFFLVLEYLEGYSLRDALKSGPLEVGRVVHIARQIASALERSHELGIIHRDLKPENIMLAPKQGDADFVKILDFGLAKLAPEALEQIEADGPDKVLTRHGSVFGTPRYMAPEQCIGDEVDGRTDLYALGLIMYEALTGQHPFDEREPRKMIKHQLFTAVPLMKDRARGVNIPPSLEALVMRAIQKARGQRHANATELLAELAEVCEREGIQPPEPSSRFPTPRPTPSSGTGIGQASPLPGPQSSDTVSTMDAADAAQTQDLPDAETAPEGPPAEETQPPAATSGQDVPTQKPIAAADQLITQPPASGPVAAVAGASSSNQPMMAGSIHPAAARRQKQAMLALALLVPMGVILGLLSLRRPLLPRSPTSGQPVLATPTSERGAALPAVSSALAAQAELDRASAAGPAELLQLVQAHPTDTRVLRALAQAYLAQGNGLEALRWQAKAVALNETSIYDGEILQAASRALGSTESAEAAIGLLERSFGTRGLDVLIALMNKPGLGHAKGLISQRLTQEEVRARASPAALVALDLSTAVRCEAKRALLPRAARDGDQRTLLQLKSLNGTHGCGVMHRGDCWACLRKDGALHNAITAITARASLAR
jgi:serine/threonine-protein kinase